jgi:Na+-transporting NADH:ubiquinone oxidoreductase subunit B
MAGAVYYFGWRSLAVILLSCATGFLTEYSFCRRRGEAVTQAVLVTSVIFALVMPPTVPFLVVVVGVVFSVLFGKEVFGGFGRNIFNPAVAGRAFVYITFPVWLTGIWAPPASGPWGALDRWSTYTLEQNQPDSVTGATPMAHLKAGRLIPTSGQGQDILNQIPYRVDEKASLQISHRAIVKSLLLGRISGTMGVTSALLILLGGAYIWFTKTASRTIILSVVLSYALFNLILSLAGVPRFYGPVTPVLGGGFLFGAIFMATDPVSAAKTEPGRIVYGIIIGLGTTVIRNFSIFNGGLMFSILLGNMFAPIVDYAIKARQQKRQLSPEVE